MRPGPIATIATALTVLFASGALGAEPPPSQKRPVKEQARPAPEPRPKPAVAKSTQPKKETPPARTGTDNAVTWGSPADHGLGCSAD